MTPEFATEPVSPAPPGPGVNGHQRRPANEEMQQFMAMTNGQGEDADVDRFLAEAGISVDDSGARIVLRFSNEDGTPLKPKPVDPILIEAEITKVLADISEAIHKKIHDGCLTIREIASRGSSNWHYLLTQELYERPHHVADVTTNDFKGNMSQFIKEATFVRLEKGNDN